MTNQISQLKTADLYLICVSDDAIETVSENIQSEGLIAHCAGGVLKPTEGFIKESRKFYPLQSFTKERDLSFEKTSFLYRNLTSQ